MITYIIINMSEIALVDFNQVLETSEQTLRLSVDGLQTVLKWEGAVPVTLNQKFTEKPVETMF